MNKQRHKLVVALMSYINSKRILKKDNWDNKSSAQLVCISMTTTCNEFESWTEFMSYEYTEKESIEENKETNQDLYLQSNLVRDIS